MIFVKKSIRNGLKKERNKLNQKIRNVLKRTSPLKASANRQFAIKAKRPEVCFCFIFCFYHQIRLPQVITLKSSSPFLMFHFVKITKIISKQLCNWMISDVKKNWWIKLSIKLGWNTSSDVSRLLLTISFLTYPLFLQIFSFFNLY